MTHAHALATDDMRSRILGVAMQLMAEKGYAATSTREVSERLGITKAGLYYHFRTKEDLLMALVEPSVEDLRRLVHAPAGRGNAGRRQLLAGYIDLILRHVELARVLSQDLAVRSNARLTAVTQPLYDRLIERLTGQQRPDIAKMARLAVALGGIQAAVIHLAADADHDTIRRSTLAAACGALGIPHAD